MNISPQNIYNRSFFHKNSKAFPERKAIPPVIVQNPHTPLIEPTCSKPVRFSGALSNAAQFLAGYGFKQAAYGAAYGWCTLKGVAGGLSMYPLDAVALGGAPVSSTVTGAAVLADCVKDARGFLKDIFQ